MTHVRADVRRFQTADGAWVMDSTAYVHLAAHPGVASEDIRFLENRVLRMLAEQVNVTESLLPESGDRLNVNVEFRDHPDGAHHVVHVHAGRGQTTHEDAHLYDLDGNRLTVSQLTHEIVGHLMLGLEDQYLDPDMLLRSSPNSTRVVDDGSIMAGESTGARALSGATW